MSRKYRQNQCPNCGFLFRYPNGNKECMCVKGFYGNIADFREETSRHCPDFKHKSKEVGQ